MPLAPPASRLTSKAVGVRAAELPARGLVIRVQDFLSRSLPECPAAISERFSSSSLPPSFPRGRRAAVFIHRGTVDHGAPIFVASRVAA